jgi:hypothetical protein
MSLHYAFEKFLVGVDTLATGVGRIRERLEGAFVSGLVMVEADDLPEPFRRKFQEITAEVTSKKAASDEGTLAATIRTLSEDRCADIARELLELFHELSHLDPINKMMRND